MNLPKERKKEKKTKHIKYSLLCIRNPGIAKCCIYFLLFKIPIIENVLTVPPQLTFKC
uniref:Uncharacterized protein n=1 Tax=Anguilla anguilla TaxID=7936 RepID=A0A0E9XNN2_ANGAN